MKLDNYIESQYRELKAKQLIDPEFIALYENVEMKSLREIFASLHKGFQRLFKTMNDRLPTGANGAHFWAEPSRELIFFIEIALGLHRSLKKSPYAFEIESYYYDLITKCESFLSGSGGSTLPSNMEKIILYYTDPIFIPSDAQKIKRDTFEFHAKLKLIGEGSYALVYKFKDEMYNKHFVLKRAKTSLDSKELERFKREFEEMSKLSSPYILEVHSYDAIKNEYIMECMDFSLDDYIQKNNGTLDVATRKGMALQVLRAFKYLNSKGLLHRDISPRNILLKKYEDVVVLKVSDFGLVKIPDSSLTSVNTEFKGYFNDPSLITEGFDNYSFSHEVFALTKLILYIMTGKTNTNNIQDSNLKSFMSVGLNANPGSRYKNIDEIIEVIKNL